MIIPKASGGQAIEIREREGHIEIEPAPTPMKLEDRAGSMVAVPEVEVPPLSDDLVRDTLEGSRR